MSKSVSKNKKGIHFYMHAFIQTLTTYNQYFLLDLSRYKEIDFFLAANPNNPKDKINNVEGSGTVTD